MDVEDSGHLQRIGIGQAWQIAMCDSPHRAEKQPWFYRLRRRDLSQAKGTVKIRVSVGNGTCFGIPVGEERDAVLDRTQVDEQNRGIGRVRSDRCAQAPYGLAAELSAKVAQENKQGGLACQQA